MKQQEQNKSMLKKQHDDATKKLLKTTNIATENSDISSLQLSAESPVQQIKSNFY